MVMKDLFEELLQDKEYRRLLDEHTNIYKEILKEVPFYKKKKIMRLVGKLQEKQGKVFEKRLDFAWENTKDKKRR